MQELTAFRGGDKVFAKMRGYPAWPARIEGIADSSPNNIKYHVLFFGTMQRGICRSQDIFSYTENKDKYSKIKRKGFKEALNQIEGLAPTPRLVPKIVDEKYRNGVHNLALNNALRNYNNNHLGSSAITKTIVKTKKKTAFKKPGNYSVKYHSEVNINGSTQNLCKKTQMKLNTTTRKQHNLQENCDKSCQHNSSNNAQSQVTNISNPVLVESAPEFQDTIPNCEPNLRSYMHENNLDNDYSVQSKSSAENQTTDLNCHVSSAVSDHNGNSDNVQGLCDVVCNTSICDGSSTNSLPQENLSANNVKVVSRSGRIIKRKVYGDEDDPPPKRKRHYQERGKGNRKVPGRNKSSGDSIQYSRNSSGNGNSSDTSNVIRKAPSRVQYLQQVPQPPVFKKLSALMCLAIENCFTRLDTLVRVHLSVSRANPDRCIQYLDDMCKLDLRPLMLKKHPEVVETIKRLRKYVGSPTVWTSHDDDKSSFLERASKLREKAEDVFEKFKALYAISDSETFLNVFADSVIAFEERTYNWPLPKVYALVSDPEPPKPRKPCKPRTKKKENVTQQSRQAKDKTRVRTAKKSCVKNTSQNGRETSTSNPENLQKHPNNIKDKQNQSVANGNPKSNSNSATETHPKAHEKINMSSKNTISEKLSNNTCQSSSCVSQNSTCNPQNQQVQPNNVRTEQSTSLTTEKSTSLVISNVNSNLGSNSDTSQSTEMNNSVKHSSLIIVDTQNPTNSQDLQIQSNCVKEKQTLETNNNDTIMYRKTGLKNQEINNYSKTTVSEKVNDDPAKNTSQNNCDVQKTTFNLQSLQMQPNCVVVEETIAKYPGTNRGSTLKCSGKVLSEKANNDHVKNYSFLNISTQKFTSSLQDLQKQHNSIEGKLNLDFNMKRGLKCTEKSAAKKFYKICTKNSLRRKGNVSKTSATIQRSPPKA